MDRRVFSLRITFLFIIIAGVLIRFTVRDSLTGVSAFYYSTPWPVLALVSIVSGLLWLRKNKLISAGLLSAAVVMLCGWFYANIFVGCQPQPSTGAQPVRVLFWNTSRGRFGVSRVIDHVKKSDAQIIGVVEAGLRDSSTETAWKGAFSERNVVPLDGDMLCVTCADVIHKMTGTLVGGGRYNYLRMMLDNTPFSLILVDIDPNPFKSRRNALAELQCIVSQHLQENLIIMGDFNTPLDSIYFDSARAFLSHGFDKCGSGFRPTWPVPVPVMMIDHIWTAKKLDIIECRTNRTWASDHAYLTAELAIANKAQSQ